jgi:hypothetical protein
MSKLGLGGGVNTAICISHCKALPSTSSTSSHNRAGDLRSSIILHGRVRVATCGSPIAWRASTLIRITWSRYFIHGLTTGLPIFVGTVIALSGKLRLAGRLLLHLISTILGVYRFAKSKRASASSRQPMVTDDTCQIEEECFCNAPIGSVGWQWFIFAATRNQLLSSPSCAGESFMGTSSSSIARDEPSPLAIQQFDK